MSADGPIPAKFLRVQHSPYGIRIELSASGITQSNIARLYTLLNKYEKSYFIVIKNLPFCLMPDATEHFANVKKEPRAPYSFSACRRCHMNKQCPGWDIRIPIGTEHATPLRDIPREVVFETTSLCNQSCILCAIDKSRHLRLDFKDARRLMDESKRLGIKAIRFTGGEPLLNDEIPKMLRYARTSGFYTLLNTGAVKISAEQLKLISFTVSNVLVSLQGFDQKTNNYLTGGETDFAQKIKNIMKLKSRIPTVRAGTIISKTLLRNFKNYASLVKKAGIDTWELYRPIQNSPPEEFSIRKDDFTRLIHGILRLRSDGFNVKIANPLPFCINHDLSAAASSMVGALADDGNSRIVWDVRGYFKPSYFIDKNLGSNIEQAWGDPFIRRLRETAYLPECCRECAYLKWCRGGSRAMAGIITGNYFHCDPLLTPETSLSNSSKKMSVPQNQS